VEPLRVRHIIHGHLAGLKGPSGTVYESNFDDEFEAHSQEDYEWLLSLRKKG